MSFRRLVLMACIILVSGVSVSLADSNDALRAGFTNPPDSARPWVYWFWLNGNITREGITADLEAMKHVGIGGVLIMEVDQGAPVGPVDFMGEQWRDLFKHVVAEAQRLGLEVNMNNDAGWNGSGGPWIKPEQSMQKVVWSETPVAGPKRVEETLSQPETVAGFYGDIEVLAFPTPGAYRIENIEVKACFKTGFVLPVVHGNVSPDMIIDQSKVVDLTAQMAKDGRLTWDAPAGSWTVMRFGHTSTGVENAPAPATGRGLECDKLSKEGIEANFYGMMGKLIEDVGPAAGKALAATHIDSWENGAQNWTTRMREEFQKRRGYDPLLFLPTMTGRVVGNLEMSERFLWDLRQTVSDLIVENYAGHLRTLAQQHGVRLSIEAYGGPCDDAPYAGQADEPMGEFWVGGNALNVCKEMASAAHTYGKPILGAEAFTADNSERWLEHPFSVKGLGDTAFCLGVNRFVFHRYAMQPWLDRRPGMTMGPWGLHYERTQTWWNMSPAWHEYLSRCQFMLRQGLFVADVCYLSPETAPQGASEHHLSGYDYDTCGADAVLTRMSVRDGRIVLPDGMSYRLLVLPDVRTMTPQLLHKIRDLVEAGATVVGPRPRKSPSLSDYPKCDEEIEQIANTVWGDCDGGAVKEHRLGKGRVVWGIAPEEILQRDGVGPDFGTWGRLLYIHRVVGETDVYFVANPHMQETTATCQFRVSGKRPEFWRPDTGVIEPASLFFEKNGVTNVVLSLGPNGSVFVVFRESGGVLDSVVSIAKDGAVLISAERTAPRVEITKAIYGVLDDPQRSQDVREKVQRIVDDGAASLNVSRLAQGDDPAPSVLKSLIVEYKIGDASFSVTGNDIDTVYLSNESVKITVEKALYGILNDPQRTRDVRDKLQHMLDTGESSFQVARLAQGDDPAVNVVKTLELDYTIDGRRVSATGTDSSKMILYEPPAIAQIAEVRIDKYGQPRIETSASGEYELTLSSGATLRGKLEDAPAAIVVNGPWQVSFPEGSGAPEHIIMQTLASLSEHAEPGVRYFSGEATYTTTFSVVGELLANGRRMYLDLGDVQVMAHATLNEHDLGILWKAPYRIDVTDHLKQGENTIVVVVANLWVNRLIGDEELAEDSNRNGDGALKEWPQWLAEDKPSPTGRIAFTMWRLWRKGEALRTSGLIGPVTLEPREVLSFAKK